LAERGNEETMAEVRRWQEALGVSDFDGALALDLGNPEVILREFKSGKRRPGGPTLGYMALTERVVAALVLMRQGRHEEARRLLERQLTGALRRVVRQRAPGQEAVGPAPK
jgi:hypothetical protein